MNNTLSLGRRGFIGGAAGAGALVALSTPSASAAPASYSPTPIPTASELHYIKRLTYGYTPAALKSLRDAGGFSNWLTAQLNPSSIPEDPRCPNTSWWKSLTLTTAEIVARNNAKIETGWKVMHQYVAYRMLRRIYSNRQLLELMVDFWEDHLYIPRNDDGVWPFRNNFGLEIERLALTSFEELLIMSTTHPAMGVSLDNARNQKNAINENLGRELLELHTVGRGNYTEADVKDSSKILTGYRVETWSSWNSYYDEYWHYVGPVKVMDFSHPNGSRDGRACTEAYLRYLARHPLTAQRICRKLARKFVSDDPPQALVSRMVNVYLQNQSQIKPVLLELFNSPEFLSATNSKVRNPAEETVAMYRALGTKFEKPANDNAGAYTMVWASNNIGYIPLSHPRPDGPPSRNEDWSYPARFLCSWDVHWTAAGGWWPKNQTVWIPTEARLPQPSIRLDLLVDHLSRTFLGEPSTQALLDAVCTATKEKPYTVVTASHAIGRWKMPFLIGLIINSPNFYVK